MNNVDRFTTQEREAAQKQLHGRYCRPRDDCHRANLQLNGDFWDIPAGKMKMKCLVLCSTGWLYSTNSIIRQDVITDVPMPAWFFVNHSLSKEIDDFNKNPFALMLLAPQVCCHKWGQKQLRALATSTAKVCQDYCVFLKATSLNNKPDESNNFISERNLRGALT